MKRRHFLQSSLSGLIGAAIGGGNLLLQGCRSRQDLDLLIKGATVFDGRGGAPQEADVAVVGDSIVQVGKINLRRAKKIINGQGLALSPGFIDIHDHTDVQLLLTPRADSHLQQGITTLVAGNCGSSPFPLAGITLEEERENLRQVYNLELTWSDLDGFFSRLEQTGIAINYATLVGHGTLRGTVVGLENRPLSEADKQKMKELLQACLEAGAFGLSTGLEYTPGSFAPEEEIIELCRVVAAYQGLYATHMRDEGDHLMEALQEAVRTSQNTGVKLQISHFKTAYRSNWSKLDEALLFLDKAREDGLDIAVDRYPYIAASTGLSFYFPAWVREGSREDFLRRLTDPKLSSTLRNYLAEREKKLGSWEQVLISSVVSEKNKRFQGQNILAAAQETGKDVFSFIRDLLVEEKGQVGMISFIMSEENLKRILSLPYASIGCDGSVYSPSGILSQTKPHPRSYGSFPRFLGQYVREEKICSLAEAIRKITSLPASRLGINNRGIIAPGFKADLVLFDPDRIQDRATWLEPHAFPKGIMAVIVNGQVVIENGEFTPALPGKVLRRGKVEKA